MESAALIIVALINFAGTIGAAYYLHKNISGNVQKIELSINSMKAAQIASASREGITEGRRLEKESPT